jgi:antitoxin HicB
MPGVWFVVRAARRISLEDIVALSRGDFDGPGSQASQAGLYSGLRWLRSEVLERTMSSDYEIKVKQLAPEDGGGFFAWVPDFPGCMSDGDTLVEAVANVRAAINEWIAEAVRLNRAVPTPTRKQAAH